MRIADARAVGIVAALVGMCGMVVFAAQDVAPFWKSGRLYMELSDAQRAFMSVPRADRERIIADADERVKLVSGSKCAVGGIINFRDIGGLRGYGGKMVRRGVLFRSGRFDQISSGGREMLVNELGIRTDLDLRSKEETVQLCRMSPLGTNVQWRLVPLLAYDLIDSDQGRKQMREALGVVFDRKNWPIAFHCKTGKDRTGTLAFMLLALLGVAEDDICLDWEVTAFYVPELSRMDHPGRYNRLLSYIRGLSGKDLREKTQGYVLSLGFPITTIESFRHDMLEETGGRPRKGRFPGGR